MKLKKGISLLLVLALSLMSFAFTVAADADTVNVAIVADVDTSALEADNTFVANIELTDIAANQLYAAQLNISYDPEVLQIVNEAGEATTTVADALVPCADIYKDGTGYFDYSLTTIDNVEGTINFAANKHGALIADLEAKVDCPEGNYTLAGIRFKVVSTGLTGIEIDGASTEIFCGNSTELADVTDITEAIRIGLPKVVSVANPEGEYSVLVDTDVDDVLDELPDTVVATFDDESTDDVDVTWACDDYDAEVPETYTFTGTLDATGIDVNGQSASVTVIVEKAEIASAESASINVPFGATEEDIEALLPDTVVVILENEAEAEVPVDWEYTYEAGVTTGDVAATGTLDLGTKYLNTGEVTAECTLVVSAEVTEETEGTVTTIVDDTIEVTYEEEATKEDVIATLPKTVEIAVEGVGTVTAFITWECADFDAETAGDYTFVGTITLPANVTLASNTIEVTVTVEEALEKEVVEVTTALEDQEVNTSSSLYLVELFDTDVDVIYQDGTTGTETIVWDEESLAQKANRVGTYTLNGVVGSNEYPVSVQVTVKGNSISDDGYYDEVMILMNNRIINGTTKTMFTGQIYVLETREAVTWTTTNKSIAFVTADGKLVGQNPGTVTITATDAEGNEGSFTLKVVMNPSTIASLSGNGSGEIVIPFTDLADYSWATRMICDLAANGVVSGKTDTLYAPGDNVTRAEYASLLVRAMKLSANSAGKEFTDVAQGEWYYNAVKTASALGIVSGYEDGSFRPNSSITREEMAIMTLRAAEAVGRNIPAKTTVSFSDADQISGYAKDAVNKLAAAQIINGMGDNNFAPQQTANRAQAAVIIYQLCEL